MDVFELDSKYVLPTYARERLAFVKGVNSTLYTESGEDYIDFGSGIAVVSVGHGNARVASVIAKQAGELIHTSNLYHIEPQAMLAKRLAECCEIDGRVFFCNSGAEANEAALKIARKYGEVDGKPKRYKVITLEHSFHGRTISTLKATGQESMHNYFGPYPDGFVYAKSLEEVYSSMDEHTVAVMIELVQGEGGVEPFLKEEIQKLAQELKKRDILLIVDEVQTGVFRSGEMLCSNLYEITPDVVTLAKGLAGGVPIGAIVTTLKDVLSPGDHGSTFGGNFLSTRASLETLDILEELKESGELDACIIKFEESLRDIVKEFPNLFEKEVGVGLMRGLRAKSSDIQKEVIKEALKNRVIVLKAGRNTVRFLPPLTITKDEMSEGFRRFRAGLEKI
ncbi:MAG: aspartate aminotransferase family protein [Campylobacterales bacterium]